MRSPGADTRLIFHAFYAAHRSNNLGNIILESAPLRIIISSEDTDTTVIAVRHAFQIAATFGRTLETAAAVDSKLKFRIHCGIP